MTRAIVDQGVLQLIKQVILEESGKLGVKVEKIILFGSRARGEAREDSDWDILVIVENRINWKFFLKLQSQVRVKLFKALGREIDLIIIDKERYEERREVWGSVEHTAAKEGITI